MFCLQKGVRELGGHSGRWGDSAGPQGTCTHVDAEVDKLWVFLLLWAKAGVGEVTPVEGPQGGRWSGQYSEGWSGHTCRDRSQQPEQLRRLPRQVGPGALRALPCSHRGGVVSVLPHLLMAQPFPHVNL